MAENRRMRWWAMAVPVVWVGAIFAGSCLPGSSVQKILWASWDKVYHIVEFAVLSAAMIWALVKVRTNAWAPIVPLMGFIIAAAYAPLDELHQSFVPGRDASIMDMTADWVGCLVGAIGTWGIGRIKLRITN
jgi:VanZ family protein